MALRLVSLPPVSTRPGLALVPRVSARLLPSLKTSLAEPEILTWSLEELYWVVTLVALKVPPAIVQFLAVAVAFRLSSVLLLKIRPGLSMVPSVRLRDLRPSKTSLAEPLMESCSGWLPALAW